VSAQNDSVCSAAAVEAVVVNKKRINKYIFQNQFKQTKCVRLTEKYLSPNNNKKSNKNI